MSSFDFLWQLLESHGVIPNKRTEAAELWNKYDLQQQRYIYRSIRDRLRAGKFVNYNPVLAIKANAPKAKKSIILSFADYYRTFGTTEEQDGWKRSSSPTNKKPFTSKISLYKFW